MLMKLTLAVHLPSSQTPKMNKKLKRVEFLFNLSALFYYLAKSAPQTAFNVVVFNEHMFFGHPFGQCSGAHFVLQAWLPPPHPQIWES